MYVFGSKRCGWRGGEWMRESGLGLRWCGWCRWGVGRGLGPVSGAVG